MNKKFDAYTYIFTGIVSAIIIFSFPATTERINAESMSVPVQPQINYFATTTIEAKAGFVYDATDQKLLFAKNATSSLPLASLTKIMTAITAIQLASSSAASTTILITPQALTQDGDTGLFLWEHWDLIPLLKFTLVASSNDGAYAIADGMIPRLQFIQDMNNNAHLMGLTHTKFFSESGLDTSSSSASSFGSAQDVARMLFVGYSKYPEIFGPTKDANIVVASQNGITHTAQNTNILTDSIPHLIAGKTGYTDIAGGNLAVMFTDAHQHTIIIVVLGSTYDSRFTDVDTLVQVVLKNNI